MTTSAIPLLSPEVSFKHDRILPPSSAYITKDDYLRVALKTTTATDGLQLAYRYIDSAGQVHYAVESLDGADTDTLTTRLFALSEGFLLGVTLSNLGGGLADGACFVSVGLQRSGQDNVPPHTLLAQGHVSDLFCVEWPPAFVRGPATIGGLPVGATAGDLVYFDGSAWITLAGNADAAKLLQENAGTPSWVAAPDSVLHTASATLLFTQLLALGTTPSLILEAPGDGKLLVVHSVLLQLTPAGPPYTVAADSTALFYLDPTPPYQELVGWAGLMDQTVPTCVVPLGALGTPLKPAANVLNKGLYLTSTAPGDLTLGEGSLIVVVTYTVATLAD